MKIPMTLTAGAFAALLVSAPAAGAVTLEGRCGPGVHPDASGHCPYPTTGPPQQTIPTTTVAVPTTAVPTTPPPTIGEPTSIAQTTTVPDSTPDNPLEPDQAPPPMLEPDSPIQGPAPSPATKVTQGAKVTLPATGQSTAATLAPWAFVTIGGGLVLLGMGRLALRRAR